MKSIFVAGDVTFNALVYFDHLPDPKPGTVFSKRFRETVGGTGAGKALALNRLGFDVTFHGLIGDDLQGRTIRDRFTAEQLHFVYDLDPAGTQRHINLMDSSGARLSIYAAYATFNPEIDLRRVEGLIAASDMVVINISNYCRRLIPLGKQHGKVIWCDIHDYDGKNPYHQDFIDGADYLTMSSDAMPDYRSFMQAMIAAGKQWVVCTHGKNGSTAISADGVWTEAPALPIDLIDSNGAGDNFFAGLVFGQVRGDDLTTCLRWGTVAAGLCVQSPELVHPDLSEAALRAEYERWYGS
jgi:sugar/nucleoside kinase (ribokinase family)